MNDQAEQIELLRQMSLNIAARLGAIETIVEGLLAVYGIQQGPDALRGVLDWMVRAHQGKPLEQGTPELANWLRSEEIRRLRVLSENVFLGIEEARAGRPLTN
ncbi:hypothetical protein [Achromobacter dolens]|uniref:hypothetical protein n=1 Tax=Achromobacter dolens TaxID=1287738 RepID=UPI0013C375D2|nr:hypothetical protein [Achromobacter dolens]